MFSQLKQGGQVYILHGDVATPFVEVGIVDTPMNTIQMSYYPNLPAYPIDMTVKVADKVIPLSRIPANAESATVVAKDGESITIACSKDAINSEIDLQMQKSVDAVNSVDFHKSRIIAFENLRKQLNPEIAEKVAQQEEMAKLKSQIADMAQNLTDLMEANKKLMAQLKGGKISSKATEEN